MTDISSLEQEVYALQSTKDFPTKEDFIKRMRDLSRIVFKRKPDGIDLSEEDYEVFLLELQKKNGLLMADVERSVENIRETKRHLGDRPHHS